MREGVTRGGLKSLAVFYLVVWTISPPLSVDTRWRIIAIAAIAVWFLASMRRTEVKTDNETVISVVFISLVVIVSLVDGGFSSVLSQIGLITLGLFFLIFKTYQEKNTFYELYWMIPVVIILLSIFNIRSTQALMSNASIARRLVRSDESLYELMRQGIGGYGLLYSQVIVFPALLRWVELSLSHRKTYFVIGIVWLFSYFYYLLFAGYTIAVVATVIGVVFLHFYNGRKIWTIVLGVIALIILGSYLFIHWTRFQSFLLNIFSGTKVEIKLEEILYAAITDTESTSVSARMYRYLASLRTIFRYPIIGGLFWDGAGGHSALLDSFAKYGLFGGYAFVKLAYGIPNKFRQKYYFTTELRLFNATLATVIIVTVLNSCPYNLIGMLLIVLPILFDSILEWKGLKHESIVDS